MPDLSKAVPTVMIHTRDRTAALAFWQGTLGLPVLSQDAYGAVLALQGITLRLADVADWVAHPHTVLDFAVPDIAAAMADLKAKGVTFIVYDGFGQDAAGIWTSPDGKARIAWFADPDGNNLSLSQTG